jgi:hypothetical protein
MDYPDKVRKTWESKGDANGAMDAAELIDRLNEMPSPQHGDTWGNWWYDQKNKVLEHKTSRYYVILKQCVNSANVLDWIAQIKNKTWASAKDLGDLVTALDDLLDLQGNICGGGNDHQFDAKNYLDSSDNGNYEGGFDAKDEDEQGGE